MSDYEDLQERYQKELDRGYEARRKGGIAWRQHCAALRNLERKMDLALRGIVRKENTTKP